VTARFKEFENENDDEGQVSTNENSEPARVGLFADWAFFFMRPWRPHRVALKERSLGLLRSRLGLARFAPFGAVLDDPIRQRTLEADVMSGFFRLDPLMLENLFALRLKFAVKRRVLQQIADRKLVFSIIRHTSKQIVAEPYVRQASLTIQI